MPNQVLLFEDLGTMDYQSAWDYQESLLQQNVRAKSTSYKSTVIASGEPDDNAVSSHSTGTVNHLLFVEHLPVYTLGKSGHFENLLVSEEALYRQGVSFFRTNRGGDITFHGPGQLTGYPIIDLEKFYTDIGRYLRNIEEVIIRTLADYGIRGERSAGETGVWIDPMEEGRERKICAIGVRCSRWITMHGFAFNVNTDLSYFDQIVPCGISQKKVTSLERETGRKIPMGEVKDIVKKHFAEVFGCEIVPTLNGQY